MVLCFARKLKIGLQGKNVLIAESPLTFRDQREKMVKIAFEAFKVNGVYLVTTGVLSLYASGRTTGMVLESGAGVSYTIPVYEGYALPHAIRRMHLGGNDLDVLMKKRLSLNYPEITLDEAR